MRKPILSRILIVLLALSLSGAGLWYASERIGLVSQAVVVSQTPTLEAAPNRSELTIRSAPSGAEVRLNYRLVGHTPFHERDLPTGTHSVSVHMEGYRAIDTLISLDAGGGSRLFFDLARAADREADAPEIDRLDERGSIAGVERQPAETAQPFVQDVDEEIVSAQPERRSGNLSVATSPAGATVFVGGRRLGQTPLASTALPEGEYDVRILLDGHEAVERRIAIRERDPVSLQEELAASEGTVRVLVIPWGSIYIDDELVQDDTDIRHEFRLPVGTHRVSGVHPVLGRVDREVRVTADGTADVIINLNE